MKKNKNKNTDQLFLFGPKKTGVILIHGWSANVQQVEGLARKINQGGFPVVAPLLGGHGTQPEDLKYFGPNEWQKEIIEIIKRMRKKYHWQKVILGGVSLGGNIAILASQKTKIEGIFLIGTPVHLKNHFITWIGSKIMPFFKKNLKKKYPKSIQLIRNKNTSYTYYPAETVKTTLITIKQSIRVVNKITMPSLIIQTNRDYLIAKYSPWIIYHLIKSKDKTLQWVKSCEDEHVLYGKAMEEAGLSVLRFVKQTTDEKQGDFKT